MSIPETTLEAFEKAQAELVDAFKAKMKKIAEEVLSDLYTDVSTYAVQDAHINFKNALRDELSEAFRKEILSPEYGQYSWGANMRKALLENHSDEIRTALISDLQGTIKTQEEHIEQLRRYRSGF